MIAEPHIPYKSEPPYGERGSELNGDQSSPHQGENNHSGPRRSHAITQALGGSSLPVPVEPHFTVDAPLAPGETLLLCSDGLTDMVADNILRDMLSKAPDPNTAVRHLTAQAFRAGGHDNISVVVARLADTSEPANCSV
jgi:serine/threonine protein phosphatase PrpC